MSMGFWNGLETHNGCQLPWIVFFRVRNNGQDLGSSLFEPGYSRFRSSKKPRKVTHLCNQPMPQIGRRSTAGIDSVMQCVSSPIPATSPKVSPNERLLQIPNLLLYYQACASQPTTETTLPDNLIDPDSLKRFERTLAQHYAREYLSKHNPNKSPNQIFKPRCAPDCFSPGLSFRSSHNLTISTGWIFVRIRTHRPSQLALSYLASNPQTWRFNCVTTS